MAGLGAIASEKRPWLYVADVKGRFQRARGWVGALLLVFFLVVPWIRIRGHPVLLLDLVHGRFAVGGFAFWAHDLPLVIFALGGAALLLAFVTATLGRAWCGWGCPQTVFVTQVFRRIERFVEGDAVKRRRGDEMPLDSSKIFRKSLKWFLFACAALILSHSFLAYFVGTEAMARMIAQAPSENPGTFAAMLILTGLVLFDFAWLREQFCVLICPYGRFQSALMDSRSLVVAYDSKRTDCVDCRRCVQVCPTGIDIREGLQMECIACTACVDACDLVMTRLKKPTGLIRYQGGRTLREWFSGRPLVYLSLLFLALGGFAISVHGRTPIEMMITRSVGQPYDEIVSAGAEKQVVNRFKVDFLNQGFETARVEIVRDSEEIQWTSAEAEIALAPGESRRIEVFARFPVTLLQEGRASANLSPVVHSSDLKTRIRKEVPLVGPYR